MLTGVSSHFDRPLLSRQTILRKCRMQGSNLRLPTCKDGTLPTELIRHIGCKVHIKIYVYISQKLFCNRFIWLALTNHEISSYRSKLDGNGLLTRRLDTCLIGSQPSISLMFLCQSSSGYLIPTVTAIFFAKNIIWIPPLACMENRTPDLLIKSQLLYQLSYTDRCVQRGLTPWPTGEKLPLSYQNM